MIAEPTPLTRQQIQTASLLFLSVLAGLEGNAPAFAWSMTEQRARLPLLYKLGVVLVTEGRARYLGHVVKRGVRPVGHALFGAAQVGGKPRLPTPLYVLGVQTRPAYIPRVEASR